MPWFTPPSCDGHLLSYPYLMRSHVSSPVWSFSMCSHYRHRCGWLRFDIACSALPDLRSFAPLMGGDYQVSPPFWCLVQNPGAFVRCSRGNFFPGIPTPSKVVDVNGGGLCWGQFSPQKFCNNTTTYAKEQLHNATRTLLSWGMHGYQSTVMDLLSKYRGHSQLLVVPTLIVLLEGFAYTKAVAPALCQHAERLAFTCPPRGGACSPTVFQSAV